MRSRAWMRVVGVLTWSACAGCGQVGSRPEFVEADRLVRATAVLVPGDGEPMAAAIGPEPAPREAVGAQPVETYIGRALAENRAVQAARFNLIAMKERIPQATALDDPMVENTIWPFPSNGPQYSIMGYGPYSLMISQQFPWVGTLRLRGEVAEQEVRQALAELCEAQLETVAAVKRAYAELHRAERSAVILEESGLRAADFVEIARVRLAGGNTSQQDELRAENAVVEVEAELATVRQARAEARARLARQLHVDPESDLRTLEELPAAELPGRVEALYALATEARPELRGQLAAIGRDVRQAELARLKYKPDVTVGLGYMTMSRDDAESPAADGRDNLGLVVGFNLPVYRGRIDASVREAEARAAASMREYESLRDESFEEVKTAYAAAESSREVLELFRESYLPRSRQALEVATIDYSTGRLDFLSLITAWRELLQVELQIARFEADLGRALADLERAVGTELAGGATVATPDRGRPAGLPPIAEGGGPFGGGE